MLVKLRISDRKCLIFCYFSEAPPPLFKISGSAPDIPKLKPPLYSFTALLKKMIWISLVFRKAAMYQTPKSTTYPMQIWIGGLDIRKHSFLSRYFMSIGDHSFKKNTCHFCVVDKYNLSMVVFFYWGGSPPGKKSGSAPVRHRSRGWELPLEHLYPWGGGVVILLKCVIST